MQQVLNLLTEMHDNVIYKEIACSEMDVLGSCLDEISQPCPLSGTSPFPPGPFALPTKNKIRRNDLTVGSKMQLVCSWFREDNRSTRCMCLTYQEPRIDLAWDRGHLRPPDCRQHFDINLCISPTDAKEVEIYI